MSKVCLFYCIVIYSLLNVTASTVSLALSHYVVFFFNDTATTEIYTLSLHDALPIYSKPSLSSLSILYCVVDFLLLRLVARWVSTQIPRDRKSTRLNSSHRCISYADFCLKKKKKKKRKKRKATHDIYMLK